MLHAFDDATGEELWAFIPPNLLTKLQALHQDVIESFVDGSPKVYVGSRPEGSDLRREKRGGTVIMPLTSRITRHPKFCGRSALLRQATKSWARPGAPLRFGKIRYGSGEKWVAFIGGGYDENQDNDPITAADSKGRAIYAFDVLTGSLDMALFLCPEC